MAGHTPGPWELRVDDEGAPMEVVASGDRESVACACAYCASRRFLGPRSFARILETDGHHYGPSLQDARLIAAAPDLLEALRGALDHLEYLDRHRLVINDSGCAVRDLRIRDAKAAIAKAEG